MSVSERITYRVLPDEDNEGFWVITIEGQSPLGINFEDKELAVQTAASAAKRRWEMDRMHTQLVIHGDDGRIQDERTYGDDPTPPEG
jgi:hypothetical protein